MDHPNSISQMDYELNRDTSQNDIFILFVKLLYIWATFMHISQQYSCHAVCKIVAQLDNLYLNENKK